MRWGSPRTLTVGAVLALCAALGGGATVSSAAAPSGVKTSDAVATHTYLKAEYLMLRGRLATEPAGLAAIKALSTRIEAECPRVLAKAPQPESAKTASQSEREISGEVIGVIAQEFARANRRQFDHFLRVAHDLRWSDRRLTRLVRSLALAGIAESELQAPNLCSDLEAWVASEYQLTSSGTKHFLHSLEVIVGKFELEPDEVVNVQKIVVRRLKPYEDSADRALARRIESVEVKLARLAETEVFAAAKTVEQALGSIP